MYGLIIRNASAHNTAYRMLLVEQELENLSEVTPEQSININHLFPLWMIERGESNRLLKFTQSYYDWLYNLGGYELTTTSISSVGFRKLIDIEQTPIEYLKHFAYTYASGFPESFITPEDDSGNAIDNSDQLKTFMMGIRQNLYQKKSNEEAYEYFFETLYERPEIQIFYPKKFILRLNGGKFSEWSQPLNSCGEDCDYDTIQSLGGSYLNGPYVFQDSFWYQDYSYLLSAGGDIEVDEETGLPSYQEALTELIHPAGVKGFFEKVESDYIPPDDYDGGFNICETPLLGNYFPYNLNSTSTIAHCMGCDGSGFTYSGPTANSIGFNGEYGGTFGWTAGDAWASVGAGSIGISAAGGATTHGGGGGAGGFNMPTYVYPHWADGLSGDEEHSVPFREIYIGEFIYLCPLTRSPNLGATGCTAGATGSACWWAD